MNRIRGLVFLPLLFILGLAILPSLPAVAGRYSPYHFDSNNGPSPQEGTETPTVTPISSVPGPTAAPAMPTTAEPGYPSPGSDGIRTPLPTVVPYPAPGTTNQVGEPTSTPEEVASETKKPGGGKTISIGLSIWQMGLGLAIGFVLGALYERRRTPTATPGAAAPTPTVVSAFPSEAPVAGYPLSGTSEVGTALPTTDLRSTPDTNGPEAMPSSTIEESGDEKKQTGRSKTVILGLSALQIGWGLAVGFVLGLLYGRRR